MVDGGDPHGPHRRACRVLRFFHVSTLDIWYVICKAGGNGKVIPHSEVEWSSFGLVIAFASSVFWLSYVVSSSFWLRSSAYRVVCCFPPGLRTFVPCVAQGAYDRLRNEWIDILKKHSLCSVLAQQCIHKG